MRKIILLLLPVILLISGCEKELEKEPEKEEPKKEEAIKSILVHGDNFFVKINKTLQLNYVVDPENAVVKWESSDPSVATVENGLVKAISTGSATITVGLGDVNATCKVEVLDDPKVNDFYYGDGSWSTSLNKDKKCVGVVYATNFDISSMRNPNLAPEKAFPPYVNDPNKPDLKDLVVSLEDLGDLMAWDMEKNSLKTNSINWFNGSENTSEILKNASSLEQFPPFKLVGEAKTNVLDWYLPSACELLKLICVFNGQTWDLEKTNSFDFGDAKTDEQWVATFKQQRDAFNARIIEAGGKKINDNWPILEGFTDLPEFVGEDYATWKKEVFDPWLDANPTYLDALDKIHEDTKNVYYWSSTSLDKYAPDMDYYTAAISFNSLSPSFNTFTFKTNQSRVRPILSF